MTENPPMLPSQLEENLASLHERGDDGTGLEELCAGHPEWAVRLRAVFARLREIDAPAGAAPAGDARVGGVTQVPPNIGPYRILSELGRGGMGVVYLAEQEHPVRQQVAIKVMKRLDDPQFLRRFEQERQALALMHHDGIAKVYRCDTTAEGHPYIVMEYVRGVPLTTYCDQHRLGIVARVQLLQQVCGAVTHAHQKGVVHRDLKPANILVADDGQGPHVKVIDFGLAKPVGIALTADPDHTVAGQILGTLAYMAPEQADLQSADVDTRADIYALGVILHELLIGQPPITQAQLARAGYDGIRRLLRDRDPRPPSTSIENLGDPEAIARLRRVSVPNLRRTVRGDLDWAVLKALEPDRSRRYGTADALAEDLQRWLAHEPLHAGPPSPWYRLRKLARRHRGQFSATAAVLVTALVGAGVAIAKAREADQQRTTAVANLAARQAQILLGEASQLRRIANEDLWWTNTAGPSVASLEAWLAVADRLRSEADGVAAELAVLRRSALPQAAAEAAAQQQAMARWPRLVFLRTKYREVQEFVAKTPAERSSYAVAIARLDAQIRQLEQEFAGLRVWRLRDQESQARHAELAALLRELGDFRDDDGSGLVASVRSRLGVLQRVVAAQDQAAAAWRQCRAAAHEHEAALLARLESVPGLWPVGRDLDSGLLEFCLATTGLVPRRGADGSLDWNPDCGLVLVLLPAATFVLGASKLGGAFRFDENSEADELPGPAIELAAFLIGKYELHQGAWLRMTGSNPSNLAPDPYGRPTEPVDLGHPVEQVSWQVCWNVLRNYGLRLPTEAQWEYAARGGIDTPYWMPADDASFQVSVNVADASVGTKQPWRQEPWNDGWYRHAPVASFQANPFGLHHVLGNVWEWCLDDYDPAAYSLAARPGDGLRMVTSMTRVARGGTFGYDRVSARSANRQHFHPEALYFDIGVRVVMPVPGP